MTLGDGSNSGVIDVLILRTKHPPPILCYNYINRQYTISKHFFQ